MKEKPEGTWRTDALTWQAESHAILNASVSSVTPSPTAPKFLTSKTPVEILAFPSLDGLEGSGAKGAAGGGADGLEGSGAKGPESGSGAKGLEGSGAGKGGTEISEILWWWVWCLCLVWWWCHLPWADKKKQTKDEKNIDRDRRECTILKQKLVQSMRTNQNSVGKQVWFFFFFFCREKRNSSSYLVTVNNYMKRTRERVEFIRMNAFSSCGK